jgi:hypothetical protein
LVTFKYTAVILKHAVDGVVMLGCMIRSQSYVQEMYPIIDKFDCSFQAMTGVVKREELQHMLPLCQLYTLCDKVVTYVVYV